MKLSNIPLTEWDWAQVQLRLLAIENSGPLFKMRFVFSSSTVGFRIGCDIHTPHDEEILVKSRLEQQEYYLDWCKRPLSLIAEVLAAAPELSKYFSPRTDVECTVFFDYGMGAAQICIVRDDKVEWCESST